MTIQRYVILNTCDIVINFLGGSTFQQQLIPCHEMCDRFWPYQVKHELTGQLIIIIIIIIKPIKWEQWHRKWRNSTHKSKISGVVKEKKCESRVMHGQYNRSMDRQLIGKEDTILWLSRGDPKGETESEIIVAHDQTLQTKCHATKYYKQKQIANADSANNLTRL